MEALQSVEVAVGDHDIGCRTSCIASVSLVQASSIVGASRQMGVQQRHSSTSHDCMFMTCVC